MYYDTTDALFKPALAALLALPGHQGESVEAPESRVEGMIINKDTANNTGTLLQGGYYNSSSCAAGCLGGAGGPDPPGGLPGGQPAGAAGRSLHQKVFPGAHQPDLRLRPAGHHPGGYGKGAASPERGAAGPSERGRDDGALAEENRPGRAARPRGNGPARLADLGRMRRAAGGSSLHGKGGQTGIKSFGTL